MWEPLNNFFFCYCYLNKQPVMGKSFFCFKCMKLYCILRHCALSMTFLGGPCKDCSVSHPVYSTVPLFPCGSLQLSCRHAPQGDHWESRQWCWQGMEQCWTAEGGSSPAHSLEFTGLETEQTKRTQAKIYHT